MCDAAGPGDPLRLERHIYIRRHGDGFLVSVEPHPVGDSLNRRCASYPAALSWARGTRQRKGRAIIDEAQVAQPQSDPGPHYGRGKVHLNEQPGGFWIVSLSPRPWGWEDTTRQFFCFAKATAYADDLRRRIFPVREKKPAVSGYLKLGLRASQQLAIRFSAESAFGLACRRNRITVLDVDSPDERLLADAMSELGHTPFVVRSGSGNFQAWYRHNGERRRVRPDPARPIDILGDGFVVAPPSMASKGPYSIIEGKLDDLLELPTMRAARGPDPALALPQAELVTAGRRNEALWRECMLKARFCSGLPELMETAVSLNKSLFFEPLPASEVAAVAQKAWAYEAAGENYVGEGRRVVFHHDHVDGLLKEDQDAFVLLAVLKRHHWGRAEFFCANAMADSMPEGGWARKRFASARQTLLAIGEIEEIRAASPQNGPAIYRFKSGRK